MRRTRSPAGSCSGGLCCTHVFVAWRGGRCQDAYVARMLMRQGALHCTSLLYGRAQQNYNTSPVRHISTLASGINQSMTIYRYTCSPTPIILSTVNPIVSPACSYSMSVHYQNGAHCALQLPLNLQVSIAKKPQRSIRPQKTAKSNSALVGRFVPQKLFKRSYLVHLLICPINCARYVPPCCAQSTPKSFRHLPESTSGPTATCCSPA